MGYIKFITNYYEQKINELEVNKASDKSINDAKELLKLMDDLVDEGYHTAYNTIEESFKGIQRLKKYIKENGEKDYFLDKNTKQVSSNFTYNETEINEYINNTINKVKNLKDCSHTEHPLFSNLMTYSKWIKEDDCSYVFLLRDTLLPYLAFKEQMISNVYFLLLSRRSLDLMTNNANLHDAFMDIIFTTLSINPQNIEELKSMIRKPIIELLEQHKQVKVYLEEFLSNIKTDKIIIVESGYNGTFPLVLSILDKRVSFKMFTTAPYLYELFKDYYFTKDYHLNRLFETFVSQDSMFNVTRIEGSKIYVSENDDKRIRDNGLNEIFSWFKYLG